MKTLVLVFLALLIAGGMALSGMALAQEAKSDATALAKAVQNPIASLVTLPLQANYNTGFGPYDRTVFNLNVQPVIPFSGEKWNLIVRSIIPINSVPLDSAGSAFGIGDTALSLYGTPAQPGPFIWALGLTMGLPTASNPELLGSGKFGIGPTAIGLAQPGRWTVGAVVSNQWSVAGDKDRDDYNQFVLQYFINFNFGSGWALGTAPTVMANWKAESGDQWTIPWGLQISKVTRFGSQPVNVLLGYYHNSEHPEGAAEEQFRFQLNFMFPTAH